MDELFAVNSLAAMATLAILEIVLGIDNVVFLAILTGKLPQADQPRARTIGLGLAALGRIALLFAISWVITLDSTVLVTLPFRMPGAHEELEPKVEEAVEQVAETGHPVAATVERVKAQAEVDKEVGGETPISVKDIVLLLGGLFLIGKATWEIGHQLEPTEEHGGGRTYSSLRGVLVQILLIDIVFSLDSVLTAVGMVRPDDYEHHWVALAIMISAVLMAIGVMLVFSGPIASFVNNHPSVKMLALSFLILIGVVLVAESLHTHVPRGYIYFSMAFSLLVETLNLRAAARFAKRRDTLEQI